MGNLCTHSEEPTQGKKPDKNDKQNQKILSTYSTQQNQLNFVLAYWNIRGLAQVSRFLLEYLGFKYTNKVYDDPQTWFADDKLKLNSSFPNLPYLSFDQTIITESQAIEELIIKKSNEAGKLLGQDLKTKSQIWMLIGVIREIFSGIIGQTFKESYEVEKQQNFERKFQDKLNQIHSFLGNKKKFLLGNISYPDFLLYELILYVKNMYPKEYENLYKNTFDNFSANFEQLEKIQSDKYPKKFLPSTSKFNYELDSQQKVNDIQNLKQDQQNINLIVEPKNQILTLAYWKIRGRVQALIFLAEYLQLEYQMKYYTDGEQWFQEDKNNINTDFPNLPYMVDNGYVLTESQAIAQYLIHKSGKQNELLNIKDPIKQATLNMLLGVLTELQNDIISMCLQKSKFDDLRIKYYHSNYHFKLKCLRNYLGDKVYLLGFISWADFLLYEVLQYVKKIYHQQYVLFFKEAFEKFENEFLQIHQIKKYVDRAKQNYEFTIFLPSQISEFTGNEFFDSFEYSELQQPIVVEKQQIKEKQEKMNPSHEQQPSKQPHHNHVEQLQQQDQHQNEIKQQSANSPDKVIQEQIEVQNLQQSPPKLNQVEQLQVQQEVFQPVKEVSEMQLILGYWNIRGRAEPIRSLLKYLKIKYENKTYLDPQQWYEGDKTNLNIDLPNLPYIIDNGIKLTESDAIVEYIVNKSGRQDQLLKIQDPKQSSQLQMIQSVIKDLFQEMTGMLKISNKDNFESIRISKYRSFFHSKITQIHDFIGDNKFIFGDQISLPDFYFEEFLQYFTKLYQQQYEQFFKKTFDRFFQAYYQIEEFKGHSAFATKFLPEQFFIDFSNIKFENFELNLNQQQQEEAQFQQQVQNIAQEQGKVQEQLLQKVQEQQQEQVSEQQQEQQLEQVEIQVNQQVQEQVQEQQVQQEVQIQAQEQLQDQLKEQVIEQAQEQLEEQVQQKEIVQEQSQDQEIGEKEVQGEQQEQEQNQEPGEEKQQQQSDQQEQGQEKALKKKKNKNKKQQ